MSNTTNSENATDAKMSTEQNKGNVNHANQKPDAPKIDANRNQSGSDQDYKNSSSQDHKNSAEQNQKANHQDRDQKVSDREHNYNASSSNSSSPVKDTSKGNSVDASTSGHKNARV
ncbi:MAG: hypothetical protein ACOYOK_02325 [Pseudobdellovibrionaceae bacterium]